MYHKYFELFLRNIIILLLFDLKSPAHVIYVYVHGIFDLIWVHRAIFDFPEEGEQENKIAFCRFYFRDEALGSWDYLHVVEVAFYAFDFYGFPVEEEDYHSDWLECFMPLFAGWHLYFAENCLKFAE